jgi:hypothetical protein
MMEGSEGERSKFYDVGFDVERTIRALFEWLKQNGYTKIEHVPSSPLWELMWATDEHSDAHLKGECTATPCAALGVARALYVCASYLRESDAYFAWIQSANQIALAVKDLRSDVKKVSVAVDEIRRASEKLHAQESRFKVDELAHRHDLMCERPAQLVLLGEAWIALLENTAAELLQKSTDPHLAQEPGKERRARLVRNTVWQHLAWDGGLDPGQIVKLVPGTDEEDYDRRKESVRKAVAEGKEDLRWHFELTTAYEVVSAD